MRNSLTIIKPPNSIFFMPVISSTSGRLHSEFVLLIFLQTHRKTDRFFAVSGVHLRPWTLPLPPYDIPLTP